MQDHMEQQGRAREAERLAEMAKMDKFAATRPMAPTANDLLLQSQPWKATTHTAYGSQQEQENARKSIARGILDENRALALQQAASKARARDEDRMEGKKALGTDSFWSAPAPVAHRRSPLSSHNGAPYALHESTAPSYYNMQPVQLSYSNEPSEPYEAMARSYQDKPIPPAGIASNRPASAMGRSVASPPPSSLAPWASDFSRSERDQTVRPQSAQVSFPWSRDIPLAQSLKGRGDHNPGYESKPRPFADLDDLAHAQAATAASRTAYQRPSTAFPWL